jgi:hypothetical protein
MRRGPLVSALCLAVAAPAGAGERWRVELGIGSASSFGSTLRVEQAGFPELTHAADWSTRAFDSPIYYALRLARADAKGAWGLRFLHHKTYLENTTSEIDRFAVSHGYNLLTLERATRLRGFELALGLGLVIAHPESTVRGQTLDEGSGGPFGGGYDLTGPTAAVAAVRRLALGAHLALVPELRFTLSRARVPVAGGEASVPNAALHFSLGLELRF